MFIYLTFKNYMINMHVSKQTFDKWFTLVDKKKSTRLSRIYYL